MAQDKPAGGTEDSGEASEPSTPSSASNESDSASSGQEATPPDKTPPKPEKPPKPDKPPKPPKAKNPARNITLVILAVVILLFVYNLYADRHTPYSNQGTVTGYVIAVTPQVAGYLTEVNVKVNDRVEEGEVLMRINPEPYELAVEAAEASLALARQNVAAQEASIVSARGHLAVSEAQNDIASRNYNRVRTLFEDNPGALSQADVDNYFAQRATARAQVESSEGDVARAVAQLGVAGDENPNIQAAIAALNTARFNLEQTTLEAPSDGYVVDVRISEGHFAAAGQPLITLATEQAVWIQANMRENNLTMMEVGDPVEFILDAAPGQVFEGWVDSIGTGSQPQSSPPYGQLPTIPQNAGWFRAPQQFPIVIRSDDPEVLQYFRFGGEASVAVYTGYHPAIIYEVTRLRMRIETWLSYVR